MNKNNNSNIDPKQFSGLEYRRQFSLFGITSVIFTLIIYAVCNVVPFFIYAFSANEPESLKKYSVIYIACNVIMTAVIPMAMILARKIEYKAKGFNMLGNTGFIIWNVFFCLLCLWGSRPIPLERYTDHVSNLPGLISAIKFLFKS